MNKMLTSVLAVGAGVVAYNYAKKQYHFESTNEKTKKRI